MKYLIFIILLISSIDLFAQIEESELSIKDSANTDTIITVRGLSTRYFYKDCLYDNKTLYHLVKIDKQALEYYETGYLFGEISDCCFIVGGLCLAIPIATYISHEEKLWKMAYLGGTLITLGIPFTILSNNYYDDAIAEFNQSDNKSKLTCNFIVNINANTVRAGLSISLY